MIKKKQNFSNKKLQLKLHQEIPRKRATNYQFRYRGTNSVGQPYQLLFLPDHIPQFVNKLNHLLCNIDVMFVCPLNFCIYFISPYNKGTNSP